jgi:hypothetical protein
MDSTKCIPCVDGTVAADFVERVAAMLSVGFAHASEMRQGADKLHIVGRGEVTAPGVSYSANPSRQPTLKYNFTLKQPALCHRIRQRLGVREDIFQASLVGPNAIKGGVVGASGGSSGAAFFFSRDRKVQNRTSEIRNDEQFRSRVLLFPSVQSGSAHISRSKARLS